MTKFIEVHTETDNIELLNIDHIVAVTDNKPFNKSGCTIVTTDMDTCDPEDGCENSINYLSNYSMDVKETYEEIRHKLLVLTGQRNELAQHDYVATQSN